MADPITSNFGLVTPTVGGDVGTWGGIVNISVITLLDTILGAVTPVTMTSSDVNLTLSQWQSGTRFKITTTTGLTGNLVLNLPRTDATSPDAGVHAVGGNFIVDNETTSTGGPWTITVKTTVGGSTGVTVAQGSRTSLYSDGTNVWYADDSRPAKLNTNAGSPQGSVTGNAGSVNAPADEIWDRTNQALYVSLGGTNWTGIGLTLPNPQGYLTPTSGTPIIPGDVSGATTIYYTPYRGNQVPIYNGTSFAVYAVPEIAIGIGGATASSIYDIFVGVVGGVVVAGWGPPWTAGSGGSVTPGACVRGTGAGGTALQRINGVWTNAAAMTLTNFGGTGGAIGVNQGTYVGSMSVDASTGQASFTRTWGGNAAGGLRKWALWNAFNRAPIILQGGDGTASWTYAGVGVWRQSNAAAGNQLQLFTGLPEEEIDIDFRQAVTVSGGTGSRIGIGLNSTTAPTGFAPLNSAAGTQTLMNARLILVPSLGIQNANMIEVGSPGSAVASFQGTNTSMVMTARYNG